MSGGERGFTLIELMIAVAMGLLLIGGSIMLYLSGKRTYTFQTDQRQIQENGRFALELLARELRQIGYLSSKLGATPVLGTARPVTPANSCPVSAAWGRMLGLPLAGLDDPAAPNAAYACLDDSDYTRGDVLTLRYVDPTAVTPAGSRLYYRGAPYAARLFTGADAGNPDNALDDVLATTHAVVARAYYVGPSGASCGGATIPSLFRKTLGDDGLPTAEEVARGVENLQLRYGFDGDGDGVIDRYRDADAVAAVADWNRVLAVQLWLSVRSECANAERVDARSYTLGDQNLTYNDRYLRQVFSTTIAIRN